MSILQVVAPAHGVVAWFKHHKPSEYAYDVLLWALVQDGHFAPRITGVALIDGRMVLCDAQPDFIRYETRGATLR